VGDEDAMLILREQLLDSSYDWAAKKSIKRTKFTPFPFQKVAAENVRKALAKGGRAQIVMACGTGKTVTMLLAAEALDAQRVLVLAPTLLLVKQLRDEWISKRRPDREWASLAVCSDIGDGMDASEIAPAEFGAPPTTNPDEIAAFLKKPGRRVVFGTYASSDRIAKAQKKAGVPSFDLAVADEAHRIAGVVAVKDKSERSHRVMLEEKEIKAVRRLFATATPRITGSKKTRDGDEILIESMDDESRFGKVAHSVTFQEAVKLKRLVPYKLVVTIVTNDEVADAVQNRRFIDVNGKPYAADEVATAIAIRRAYKDLGISKIISYHSRVAGARAFADLITQVPGRGKSPVTEHVAGSMPVNDRRQVLNRLAAATEPYLVTNARCLTEGIDVPALDAVAFADPRKSQVDIVQAVGRAMRRPTGTSKKTTGYIILPVYITKKELKDPEAAVEGSAFEPVLQVLRALKDHDPFMARFMAKILVAKGKKPHQKASGIQEILEVSIGDELDKVLARRLMEAVQLRAIEVTADSFERGIETLRNFFTEFGHTRVGQREIYLSFKLGQWVAVMRDSARTGTSRKPLSASQAQALEELGFSWNPYDEDYEKGLRTLKKWVLVHGNGDIPRPTMYEGFPLGRWVEKRRSHSNQGSEASRKQELTDAGMIWDVYAFRLEQNMSLLCEWLLTNDLADLKRDVKVQGVRIGDWLGKLRQQHAHGQLDVKTQRRLEAIGVPLTRPHDAGFERGLLALEAFNKREGHSFATRDVIEDGHKLGLWLNNQRAKYRARKLTPEQVKSLERAGVVWDRIEEQFAIGLQSLKEYVAAHGDGDVPMSHVQKGFPLGSWVGSRRGDLRKGKLDVSQRRQLESAGIVWVSARKSASS
jgi:superfamily II DNA or RNA helicase